MPSSSRRCRIRWPTRDGWSMSASRAGRLLVEGHDPLAELTVAVSVGEQPGRDVEPAVIGQPEFGEAGGLFDGHTCERASKRTVWRGRLVARDKGERSV